MICQIIFRFWILNIAKHCINSDPLLLVPISLLMRIKFVKFISFLRIVFLRVTFVLMENLSIVPISIKSLICYSNLSIKHFCSISTARCLQFSSLRYLITIYFIFFTYWNRWYITTTQRICCDLSWKWNWQTKDRTKSTWTFFFTIEIFETYVSFRSKNLSHQIPIKYQQCNLWECLDRFECFTICAFLNWSITQYYI